MSGAPTQNDITAAISTITSNFSSYIQDKNRNAATINSMSETDAANAKLALQLRELKRQQETLDRQFLDASEVKKPATVFQRMGLIEFEDWALAAFFLTLGIFCLGITLQLASISTLPIRVMLFGILLTAFLMGLAFILIRILG